MYILFAPAILAFLVISVIYIKNDLTAFNKSDLRMCAAFAVLLCTLLFAAHHILAVVVR